jgi:shikimate 5-dehydrogenase
MPFKQDCIALVDELDASAKAINSVNTIVNTHGYLKAYNTDYIAITTLLRQFRVPTSLVSRCAVVVEWPKQWLVLCEILDSKGIYRRD